MLRVDLARLKSRGSDRIDADLAASEPVWAEIGVEPAAAFAIRLEASKAGPDVIVRGRIEGDVLGACRRCLAETRSRVDEPVLLVFRSGIDPVQAEREEVCVLLENVRDLDLEPAIRELLILANPRYTLCRDGCRGRCAGCGADLNLEPCSCTAVTGDERWAVLRRLAE